MKKKQVIKPLNMHKLTDIELAELDNDDLVDYIVELRGQVEKVVNDYGTVKMRYDSLEKQIEDKCTTDKDKCTECENEAIQKYADLYIEYEKLQRYTKMLEKGHDIAQELNQTLRDKIDKLENKLKFYDEV